MATLIKSTRPLVIKPNSAPLTIRPPSLVRIVPTSTVRIERQPMEVLVIAPSRTETVRPPARGVWDERGWSRRSENGADVYEGLYRIGTRRYSGRVRVERGGRQIYAYIYDPPPEIKRHRHGVCFQQVGTGTGWFHLHWQRSPRNVDEAILYIEKVLDESLNS